MVEDQEKLKQLDYFGEPTEEDIMIHDIPIKKDSLIALQNNGYTEDEAMRILSEAVGISKKWFMGAIRRVPRAKRENLDFRRGFFETLFKGTLGKGMMKIGFKQKADKVIKRMKKLFLRTNKALIDQAVAQAILEDKNTIKQAEKMVKKGW